MQLESGRLDDRDRRVNTATLFRRHFTTSSESSERPPKRPKLERNNGSGSGSGSGSVSASCDSHDEESFISDGETPQTPLREDSTAREKEPEELPAPGGEKESSIETPFECSLPPVKTDKDAIEEYETLRASQDGVPDGAPSGGLWVKGRSSIYVDAFNLALDTVLGDEADLFDERENAVFDAWKSLDYESQYLYVRLFLRKTSAWHRSDRLVYYAEISDPETAIKTLQESRELPERQLDPGSSVAASAPLQGCSLDESSFTFADSSETSIGDVEEALALLSLDELKMLAKEAKVQGRNKAELQRALSRMSSQQSSLLSLGLRRTTSTDSGGGAEPAEGEHPAIQEPTSRGSRLLEKVLAITGPCIRLSPAVFGLFGRVHLVFYRSTEWTEKSLTTIILAKISRRNFPEYVVCRSSNIFPSRTALLEFEQATKTEFEVDSILENGPTGEDGFREVLRLFAETAPRWRELLQEEQLKEDQVYEFGEGVFLRRLNAAHALTRIAHKAAYVHGRLHQYREEHALLTELLAQRLFHLARRGSWYQRKALLEEHYMAEAEAEPASGVDLEARKKQWRRTAVSTCEQALEDRDCHLIYHYDLQKRLVKLEKRLKIPRRLQHDFGHVRLHAPEEHTVSGIQIKKADVAVVGKLGRGPSTKTIWLDEQDGGAECSVEDMCLSHYRSQGWKGYHSEGGILRTLFAYLFYDVLFAFVPNVFQTAYQTCPLDLHTDSFFAARASEINRRLVEIANGGGSALVKAVDKAHRDRRTCVVGLNWDFAAEDLVELVESFRGEALAAVCKVMAQEYRQRGGGVPDLVLWRTEPTREVMFAEVKSANDRLSDTQRLWIHVLTASGVRVALTAAVAREVRVVDDD